MTGQGDNSRGPARRSTSESHTHCCAQEARRSSADAAVGQTSALPSACELVWPIKASFLAYLAAMSDGRYILSIPVTEDAGGFRFPSAHSGDQRVPARDTTTSQQFRGSVEFRGHRGHLRVVICDPLLTHDGENGTLSISDPDWDGRRMTLALFDVAPPIATSRDPASSPSGAVWRGTNVRLTADGADLFFRAYEEGELLDDFVIIQASPGFSGQATALTPRRVGVPVNQLQPEGDPVNPIFEGDNP
ncbi:HtaA domain-containing protein [Arthrobacter sp. TMT4-20]